MTQQQTNPLQAALSYLQYQGAKPLSDLDKLMQEADADWQACLAGMTEGQAAFHPQPEPAAPATPISGEGVKWSVKETIGHFLVSERSLNGQVAELSGVAAPHQPGPAVRQMGMQSADDEAQPIAELRRRISAFFEETQGLIKSLESCPSLDAAFPHPVFGPLKSTEWIAFHRLHAMDHIRQIQNTKASPGYPKG